MRREDWLCLLAGILISFPLGLGLGCALASLVLGGGVCR